MLNVQVYESLDEFLEKHGNKRLYLATTKATQHHSDPAYQDGDFFLFGKETKGLPKELLAQYSSTCIKVPMLDHPAARSLNLSNSVSIIVYEAFRQINYAGLI